MNYDQYISFEHQGYPVAMMPDHQDDCERWHFAIKIDHNWYDIDYGALNFDRVAAYQVIAKVAKQSLEDYRKRTDASKKPNIKTMTYEELLNAKFLGEGKWFKDSAYQVYELNGKYYSVIVCNSMNKEILEDTITEIKLEDIDSYI